MGKLSYYTVCVGILCYTTMLCYKSNSIKVVRKAHQTWKQTLLRKRSSASGAACPPAWSAGRRIVPAWLVRSHWSAALQSETLRSIITGRAPINARTVNRASYYPHLITAINLSLRLSLECDSADYPLHLHSAAPLQPYYTFTLQLHYSSTTTPLQLHDHYIPNTSPLQPAMFVV